MKWLDRKRERSVQAITGLDSLTRKRVSQTALLRYLGAKCADCGTMDNLTVDHFVPLSSGGKNDETNIRILCRKCQNKRHGIDKKKRDYR